MSIELMLMALFSVFGIIIPCYLLLIALMIIPRGSVYRGHPVRDMYMLGDGLHCVRSVEQETAVIVCYLRC